MTAIDYRHPSDRDELDRFIEIARRSLFFQDPGPDWVDLEGPETFRVMTCDGELVGGMAWQRVGQYVGGSSVPCGAVRCVAVRPDARAGGVASEMMRRNLEEMREEGVPLASLYPATHKVYRRAGYEFAGNRLSWALNIHKLEVRERELSVRAGTEADGPLLKRLWAAFARHQPGQLDKSAWLWDRVLHTWKERELRDVWIFEGDDGPEGYAITEVEGSWSSGKSPVLRVVDRATLTGRAAKRLLTLMGDHRSLLDVSIVAGGVSEPLLHHMPERAYEEARVAPWMDRIVDVAAALQARGWAPGRAGRLELRVQDDVLSANDGCWTLEVGDGRADCVAGGSGALQIDVRGLAALYTGFQPAEELAAVGLAEGSEGDLALASSLFAGPSPWMNDAF